MIKQSFLVMMTSLFATVVYTNEKKTCDALCESSFIVQKADFQKKYSTNELKEKLGKTTEQVFDVSTQVTENLGKLQVLLADKHKEIKNSENIALVHKALGGIQQTVCYIQRACSSTIKKLIDNENPFKKAKKQVLQESLEALSSAHTDMVCLARDLGLHVQDLKRRSSLVALKQNTENHEKLILAVHTRIKQDVCLKDI